MKQVNSFTVNTDGSCSINGRTIAVPNVHLEARVAEGASGVVFRGRHRYLPRDVAVKFWLKLRPRDKRDKFAQGIAEARKADGLSPDRAVLRLFDAGDCGGYFYVVMEYYDGITLKSCLEQNKPNLGKRRELAVAILDEVVALAEVGANHGDLHTSNILVSMPEESYRYIDFRIIDFGTSLFSAGRQFSMKRHWEIVTETMDRLLFPFSYRQFVREPFPASGNPEEIGWWYYSLVAKIKPLLIECGAAWLKDRLGDEENDSVDPNELKIARSFLAERSVELTKESLGGSTAFQDYLRDDLKPHRDVRYRRKFPKHA